jgi:hypothetical protein
MKFHHRHHVKHDRKRELKELRESTIEKIHHLSKKIGKPYAKEKKDEYFQDFFDAVKHFFTKYLGVHHYSTYEEIIKELQHKRIDKRIRGRTSKFLQKLVYVEYGNIDLSTKRTRLLFDEFKYLVDKYIALEEAQRRDLLKFPKKVIGEFFGKLREGKQKEELKKKEEYDDSITKIKELFLQAKEALKKEDLALAFNIYKQVEYLCYGLKKTDIDKIYNKLFLIYKKNHPVYVLMHKAKLAFKNKDKEEAKRIYVELKEYYENLPEEKQQEFYDGIYHIYKPRAIHEIDGLIDQGYYFLAKKDMEKTKTIYNKIRDEYKELPENERKETYPKMMSFYADIKEIFSS